jgi:hypothetical protein
MSVSTREPFGLAGDPYGTHGQKLGQRGVGQQD